MMHDVRYALRLLTKSPGFALVALLALALGIGATTAIFSVVNAVLVQQLPYPDSGRLYAVLSAPRDRPGDLRFGSLSDPQFLEYRRQNDVFAELAAFSGRPLSLTGAGEPRALIGCEATPSLFRVLGVRPSLGRVFGEGEENVAVLSANLWRAAFGANPTAIGRAVSLDGAAYTIAGVMPDGFDFPPQSDLWIPARLDPARNNLAFLRVVGRLKPALRLQQAQAQMETIAQRLGQSVGRDTTVRLVSLHERTVASVRRSLLIFMGAVGLVLLIACANVANLLLARAAARRQEFAVRASLGAGRWRLARQLLTESAVLALAGGALGCLFALWGVSALVHIVPPRQLPRVEEIGVDAFALAFTLGVSILTGLLSGMTPAWQLSQTQWSQALKEPGRQRMRGWLVVAELALSLVLLVSAGLLIRSFLLLRSVDPGFRAERVLTMSVDLPSRNYDTTTKLKAFHRHMLERLASLPGVAAAGAVNWLPFGGALLRGDFIIEGRTFLERDQPIANKPAVSPGYFQAIGVRLLAGREFEERDDETAPGAVIISQTLARRIWPNENPLGRRVSLAGQPGPKDWLTIVGVVEDVKQESLAKQAPPAIYQPVAQVRRSFFLSHMTFFVRTAADPRKMAGAVRAQLRAVDKDQPIQALAPLEELIATTTAEPLFQTRLLAAFAALALVLAAVGIYGVMATSVADRTREIGIRMALGADRGAVLRLVLSHGVLLVAAGLALGAGGAFAATRVLKNLLFEVKPEDPITFVAGTLVLAAVALAAAWAPAQRATAVDPNVALRYE